jgi:hypothetical protein
VGLSGLGDRQTLVPTDDECGSSSDDQSFSDEGGSSSSYCSSSSSDEGTGSSNDVARCVMSRSQSLMRCITHGVKVRPWGISRGGGGAGDPRSWLFDGSQCISYCTKTFADSVAAAISGGDSTSCEA